MKEYLINFQENKCVTSIALSKVVIVFFKLKNTDQVFSTQINSTLICSASTVESEFRIDI